MTARKNKRLNDRDRSALYRLAEQRIGATQDTSEVDAAYELAADAILAAIENKWPQKDMRVLARYDTASPDPCVFVSTGGSNYDRFEFREGDKRIALRPNRGGCHRIPLLLEGEAERAFRDYKAKSDTAAAERNARLKDFKALIYGTPSFNALVEVWPAAEELRDKIVGLQTALAVLSDEVIGRIKADPALGTVEA